MPQQPNSGWTPVEDTAGWTPAEESIPTPQPKTPGFFKRYAQGVGVPSSAEEAKAMQPSTAEVVLGPAATAGKVAYNYGKNLVSEGGKMLHEASEAGTNIGEGGPVGANIGKAGAGLTDFLLKGVLGPVGGSAVSAWGEDVHHGNKAGAAGDALAVLTNALLLKGSMKPSIGTRTSKIAFAGDLPETMDAGKQVKLVLPDLDKAAAGGGVPKTVGELLTTVKQAKDAMNKESGLAMFPIRGRQYVPIPISDAIKAKITPDMAMTPEGRQMESALRKAATDYQKPWTFDQLDAARTRAQQRLRAYYRKGSTGKYADTKTDSSVIVDKAIADGVQDIVYPAMDASAGRPKGYFASLKKRQGTLIQMEEALTEQSKALSTRTAKIKGSPRFSTENVSAYGHPTSSPGVSVHKLQNVIIRPNPAARANAAVTRSFSGRPLPTAAIYSLPVRELLLPQDDEQEPVKNRKEALELLGR